MDVKTLLIILTALLIEYTDAAAVPTDTKKSKHYTTNGSYGGSNSIGLILGAIPSSLSNQYTNQNDVQWQQQQQQNYNRYPINTYTPETCATKCPADTGCLYKNIPCAPGATCYPQPVCEGTPEYYNLGNNNNHNNNRYPYTNGWNNPNYGNNNNGWGYEQGLNNGGRPNYNTQGWNNGGRPNYNTQSTSVQQIWPYTNPSDNGGTASITVSNSDGQHLHCTPVECNVRCPRGLKKNAKGCYICQCT